MERIINMSTKELDRVPILEQAVKSEITNQVGAKQLGVSTRHFRRLKRTYKKEGIQGLAHKLRNRISNRKISQEEITGVLNVVQTNYGGFGPTLAHEKLSELGSINFSVEKLRQEMIKAGLHKGKHRRKADVHQPRERREQLGELVQADGSPYAWFDDKAPICNLLVFIDDATGKLLWLQFVESESTETYFNALEGYLTLHGKPLALYVDKHGVFRVNTTKLNSASTSDNNGLTQFGRAMKQLDIELIFANSPQAKGRVERVNATLQDRLTKELRLKNISSMEEGNKFLPQFIKAFNAKFAVQPKSAVNAHRPLLHKDNLNEILCMRNTRVVSKNLTLQYQNTTYLIDVESRSEYLMRKAQVDIVEQRNGETAITYHGRDLKYTVMNIVKPQVECDSKQVNKVVDRVKVKQGKTFEFNLLGRTFLLWRKADISTWG